MKSIKKVCNQSDCQHKGKLQTITNFYRNRKMKDGRSNTCKDCIKRNNPRTENYTPRMSEAEQKEYVSDMSSFIKANQELKRLNLYGAV